eukprot:m.44772 g.44772  ORF g.44772 m.44772 type:complete len:322 (+) comp8572_c0_seq1:145-1110(+)
MVEANHDYKADNWRGRALTEAEREARFETSLREAEAARAEIWAHDAAGDGSAVWNWAALGATDALPRLAVLTYDPTEYTLGEHFAQALVTEAATLERLHLAWGEDYTDSASCIKPKRSTLQKMRDPADPDTAAFVALYERWMCEVALPALRGGLSEDAAGRILFQAVPCLRIQQPSQFGTIRPHTDRMYAHSPGTLNVWVPLTSIHGPTATLQIEAKPGARDFQPLPCKTVGEFCVGDMAECMHYTTGNSTDATRVSFDARVLPEHCYSAQAKHEFELGAYYSVAEWCPLTSSYSIVRRGFPSRQHGFPHTTKPRTNANVQ